MAATPAIARVCTVSLLVACASPSAHVPKDFELDEGWPAASSPTPVQVRAADVSPRELETALAGTSFVIDLRTYTQALADRVGEALASQGVALAPGAPRSLELEVVYARILPGAGNMHCLIDYTVRAGDGYVHGLQARAFSIDAGKACNAALSEAAASCLRDPQVLAYLAAPISAGSP